MNEPRLTVEKALEIQADQLANWRTKLNAEVFTDLVKWAKEKNSLLNRNASGYEVARGTDLDSFIANWQRTY